jgi:DNA ligase-associated metallophosphoesterase
MIELAIEVAGETLVLHRERALWWPRRRTLLLADVHFGKGSVLRRAGLAVPTGQTLADLARLDALIAHYRPAQVVVLGDLVHGAAPSGAPWIASVVQWRQRHAAIAMRLVAGNHDRHFDAGALGFDVVGEALTTGPFSLHHAPCRIAGTYVLAGHVHPGTTLRDGWRRHRLPAFRFNGQCGLLPAFGALTGLHDSPPRPRERIVAVTPAGLLDLGLPPDRP